MNKLPDCPCCENDELWRVPGKTIHVRCYFCGWDSGPIEPPESDLVIMQPNEAKLIEAHVIGVGAAIRNMQAFQERILTVHPWKLIKHD